jgi:hypothetical protein
MVGYAVWPVVLADLDSPESPPLNGSAVGTPVQTLQTAVLADLVADLSEN